MTSEQNVRCAACGHAEQRYTLHPRWVGPSWHGKPNPDYARALTRRPCEACGGEVELTEKDTT